MIVVAGSVRIRPETRQEAIQLAVWMARETQTEPGCITYRFSSDLEHPDTIHIFEEWTDQAALEAHFRTPHMAQFNAKLGAFLAERPTVTRYAVSEHGPI